MCLSIYFYFHNETALGEKQNCRWSLLPYHRLSLLCGCMENPGENAGEFGVSCCAGAGCLPSLEAASQILILGLSWEFAAGIFQVCNMTCPMLSFAGKASQREAVPGSPKLDCSHNPYSN